VQVEADAAEESISAAIRRLQQKQRTLKAGREAARAWQFVVQVQNNRCAEPGGGCFFGQCCATFHVAGTVRSFRPAELPEMYPLSVLEQCSQGWHFLKFSQQND
jgi:hypothetical protein